MIARGVFTQEMVAALDTSSAFVALTVPLEAK